MATHDTLDLVSSSDLHGIAMPDILDENGQIRLMPFDFYGRYSRTELRVWCHLFSRYGVATAELVAWLQSRIGSRSAIEIGAGAGDLCHHLGIPGTDNYCQTFPDVALVYEMAGQPTIRYPKSVERIDAISAWAKYRPDVVVASWVTEWIDPNLPPPPQGSSIYGVHENVLVQSGVTYILIGNRSIHGQKKIMQYQHETLELPFLLSRSKFPEQECVWVWNDR